MNKLTFTELMRPKKLDGIIGNKNIVNCLKNFIENKNIPNLLFYGPPGVGKTTAAFALCRELYGDNFKSMVLELNASDNRNIQVVRDIIKEFVCTKSFYSNEQKFVILDEADSMTSDAQFCMRRIIEKYTGNARFCIICNTLSKIIPAIQSRCTPLQFIKPSLEEVNDMLKRNNLPVVTSEQLEKYDLRKILNNYQLNYRTNIPEDDQIIKVLFKRKTKKSRIEKEDFLRDLFEIKGMNIINFNKILCNHYNNNIGNKKIENFILKAYQIENSSEFINSKYFIDYYIDLFE